MKKILLYRFLSALFLTSVFGCTTPYNYQTNGYEDIIVIEAMITNDYKYHEIKLSRSYALEESAPKTETQAIVYVSDDAGNTYEFVESNGSYISKIQFQAVAGRKYQLHVLTKNGRTYLSTPEILTTQTSIESLQAAAVTKNNVLGVEITVNSTDPTNTSKYYRYEYEETSKIVAPKWYSEKAVANGRRITFVPRTEEARICFTSRKSNELLTTNTSDLTEDKVSNFPVRFISSSDNFIRSRYSILVKQYVESFAAHTFYETLKTISNSGSILSQTQPGFLSGNIKSVDNPGEKVMGFFNVSSYSEKRLFFNFTDLFPNTRLPEYQYYCPAEIPEIEIADYYYTYCANTIGPSCQNDVIVDLITKRIRVFFPNDSPSYLLYPIECGDCTSFSSNIKPSFWID
ncbi:uncharacterized protein DUF4249 [Flavobacterium sp. 270]|uniref:DUF4249 domain-containing protein n=1 Tax=Flavobacterium sp. 270 TaxID=2512114 RepID=UPI0010654A3A|nr:DUF4249 domain-containing protein [Flavobacterium sp. 270]TDW49794.1 uncharacterized protein DUF4249 [Flavobacterium sp. 270]